MEEVQKVIAEIEFKVANMRSSLVDARSENNELTSEVQLLNDKLSQRAEEVKDFREKYDGLMRQNEERLSLTDQSKKGNESQIDALVREIDDCIGRLKA
jgi:chromosome segregation ATPase